MQMLPAASAAYAFCRALTTEMLRSPEAAAFARPVSELWAAEDLPDYDVYVAQRMDLGTVASYMDGGYYVAAA